MIEIELVSPYAKVPSRGSLEAAGLDLYAAEEVTIRPMQQKLVRTGIKVAIPKGAGGLIWSRSKLANKCRVHVAAGVIDSDYRGEVFVLLENRHADDLFKVEVGDKIAQLIVQLVDLGSPRVVDYLYPTTRGSDGILDKDLRLH